MTGKAITLRLPEELHGALKNMSENTGIPVVHLINLALWDYMHSKIRDEHCRCKD